MLKQAMFATILMICVAMFLPADETDSVWYDCSIAEFNLNYPLDVKEHCQKLQSK